MGFLFSRRKKETLNKDEQFVLQSKQCRDKLKNYIKRLENDADLNKQKARDLLRKGEREKAKLFLCKVKMCRSYVASTQGQLNLIEEQLSQVQMTLQQKETMLVLQRGNDVLKELQKEVNIEKLESISEEMNDLKQSQEEVSNFLRRYNIDNDEFEGDVERELQKMMKENKFVEVEQKKDDEFIQKLENIKVKEEKIAINEDNKEMIEN